MRRYWMVGMLALVVAAGSAVGDGPGGPDCVLIGIPGDADMDLDVDLDDFVILKSTFGTEPPPGPSWHQGDFDQDSLVTLNDFVLLKQNFSLTYDWVNEMPDLDCDGDVDLDDLDLGMAIYGTYVCDPCWPVDASADVPEPAAASLLVVGALALLRRRRA